MRSPAASGPHPPRWRTCVQITSGSTPASVRSITSRTVTAFAAARRASCSCEARRTAAASARSKSSPTADPTTAPPTPPMRAPASGLSPASPIAAPAAAPIRLPANAPFPARFVAQPTEEASSASPQASGAKRRRTGRGRIIGTEPGRGRRAGEHRPDGAGRSRSIPRPGQAAAAAGGGAGVRRSAERSSAASRAGTAAGSSSPAANRSPAGPAADAKRHRSSSSSTAVPPVRGQRCSASRFQSSTASIQSRIAFAWPSESASSAGRAVSAVRESAN